MDKRHNKIKRSKSRWALKSSVVLILTILLLAGKSLYRRTFFSKATAVVSHSDFNIIGADGADDGAGVVPRFNKKIEVEFKTEDGRIYRTTLRSPRKFWAEPEQELPIEYKISNPKICYLD